jgi:hypothetical protein
VPNEIDRISLHRDIKILSGLLLREQHFEEANWLWMALGSPASTSTYTAQKVLRQAVRLARQHGYRAVAAWLEQEVLQRPKNYLQ